MGNVISHNMSIAGRAAAHESDRPENWFMTKSLTKH